MSRPLRIDLVDGWYHVLSRGLERRDVVADDRDRHGDDGRDMALWLGRRHGGLTLAELGVAVGGASAAVRLAAGAWPARRPHALPGTARERCRRLRGSFGWR